jgi:hypothetical protein
LLYRLDISEVNRLLDDPRACSQCGLYAHTMIFEDTPAPYEGVVLSIQEKEGLCLDHLTYEHMMIESL